MPLPLHPIAMARLCHRQSHIDVMRLLGELGLDLLGNHLGSENANPGSSKHWILLKVPKQISTAGFFGGSTEMPQLAVSPEEVSANEGRPRWRSRPSHPDPRSTGAPMAGAFVDPFPSQWL